MGWRQLLFANWAVDPAAVAARIPDGLDVDTFDGRAWLSVVPFTNEAIRPRGLPATVGMDLPELNLRTYVTCEGRSGVYFFSLDAPRRLAVYAARRLHHLPYYHAHVEMESPGTEVQFTCRRCHPGARAAALQVTYEPAGDAFVPDEGTLAGFLVDRTRLFAEAPDGTIRHTAVHHPSWRLTPATADIDQNTVIRAAGFDQPTGPPIHFVSPGVDVVASPSHRWPAHR